MEKGRGKKIRRKNKNSRRSGRRRGERHSRVVGEGYDIFVG